jgi:hypothetical protein
MGTYGANIAAWTKPDEAACRQMTQTGYSGGQRRNACLRNRSAL